MFFVTGTDTDSGKTLVSSALLTAVNRLGNIAHADSAVSILAANTMLTLGVKPIALVARKPLKDCVMPMRYS